MSIREAILQCEDLPRKPLTIPEWNGVTLYVHTLSGEELSQLQDAYARVPVKHRTACLAVFTTKDEEGNFAFQPGDVAELAKKSGRAVKALGDLAIEMNHLSVEGTKELEKNSDSAPS